MTVFVLIVVGTTRGFIESRVDVSSLVFAKAEHCLRASAELQQKLAKDYSTLSVFCRPQEVRK